MCGSPQEAANEHPVSRTPPSRAILTLELKVFRVRPWWRDQDEWADQFAAAPRPRAVDVAARRLLPAEGHVAKIFAPKRASESLYGRKRSAL